VKMKLDLSREAFVKEDTERLSRIMIRRRIKR
jgi:hypothetical protein